MSIPGWLWTHRNPISVSQVLRWQACATMSCLLWPLPVRLSFYNGGCFLPPPFSWCHDIRHCPRSKAMEPDSHGHDLEQIFSPLSYLRWVFLSQRWKIDPVGLNSHSVLPHWGPSFSQWTLGHKPQQCLKCLFCSSGKMPVDTTSGETLLPGSYMLVFSLCSPMMDRRKRQATLVRTWIPLKKVRLSCLGLIPVSSQRWIH